MFDTPKQLHPRKKAEKLYFDEFPCLILHPNGRADIRIKDYLTPELKFFINTKINATITYKRDKLYLIDSRGYVYPFNKKMTIDSLGTPIKTDWNILWKL